MTDDYPFHVNRKIAVVVPAYNEECLLSHVLAGIPGWVYRIVVVDDASTDDTPEVAKACAKRDSRIVYLRLKKNSGVGRAIIEGYKLAKEQGCDIAAVMAGDDQMDPRDLERLVMPVVCQCAGYAKGNRLGHQDIADMPVVRRFGTTVLSYLTCAAAGIQHLDDMQCGYTALDLDMLPLIPLEEVYPRYGFPNDFVIKLAAAGVEIVDVPVRPVYGDEESGFTPVEVVLPISKILIKGYVDRLAKKPLVGKVSSFLYSRRA